MPIPMKVGEKPGLVVTAFGKTTARPCKSSWHTSSAIRRENNRTAVHLAKRIVCDTASAAPKKRQSLKKDKPPPLPIVSKCAIFCVL